MTSSTKDQKYARDLG